MKCSIGLCVALVALFAWSCGSTEGQHSSVTADDNAAVASSALNEDADDGEELTIAASEIPAAVLKAAEDAVPGFVADEAEQESEGGSLVYCVHGTAGGTFYEIEVNADGTEVLEIEEGEDDDDEVDDDDDD